MLFLWWLDHPLAFLIANILGFIFVVWLFRMLRRID